MTHLLWASQRFIFFPLKTKQTKRELKAIEWTVTGYSHDIRKLLLSLPIKFSYEVATAFTGQHQPSQLVSA